MPTWDWRGNDRVAVKVESWNSTRKPGQTWRTLCRFGYINEYAVAVAALGREVGSPGAHDIGGVADRGPGRLR